MPSQPQARLPYAGMAAAAAFFHALPRPVLVIVRLAGSGQHAKIER